jgi:plastocyanin
MRPLPAPRPRGEFARALAIIVVATGAGCAESPASPSPGGAVVAMTDDFRFEPAAITIRAGQAVDWRNASHFVHTATDDPELAGQPGDALLPPGAEAFNSGEVQPGNSYRRVLTVPGSYRYFCIPHEGVGMLGRITVLPP